MTRDCPDTNVEPWHASAVLTDGRLSLSAAPDDAMIRLEGTAVEPLSEGQPVATLRLTGDSVEVEAELSAGDAAALADALDTVAGRNERRVAGAKER